MALGGGHLLVLYWTSKAHCTRPTTRSSSRGIKEDARSTSIAMAFHEAWMWTASLAAPRNTKTGTFVPTSHKAVLIIELASDWYLTGIGLRSVDVRCRGQSGPRPVASRCLLNGPIADTGQLCTPFAVCRKCLGPGQCPGNACGDGWPS